MADVRPFRPLYYNPEVIPSVTEVLPRTAAGAPPDDLEADRQRSPWSFRHLEPGLLPARESALLHTRASDCLRDWIRERVLSRLEKPGFLILVQRFDRAGTVHERRGLIASVDLHEYGDRVILPHERTLRVPREARQDLLASTRAQFSPIFLLYNDAQRRIEIILEAHCSSAPLHVHVDLEGVRHELHVLQGEEDCAFISTWLAKHQLLIADGHHRYEAALALAREDGALPGARVLGYLANAHDQGVFLDATHRLIELPPGVNPDGWRRQVARYFRIEQVARETTRQATLSASARVRMPQGGMQVCTCSGEERYTLQLLRPRSEAILEATRRHRLPEVAARSPLILLHDLLLPEIAGLTVPEQESTSRIRYSHVDEDILDMLRTTPNSIAVLLPAPSVAEIMEISNAGLFLPQKSTFFSPKVPAGLAMLDMLDP